MQKNIIFKLKIINFKTTAQKIIIIGLILLLFTSGSNIVSSYKIITIKNNNSNKFLSIPSYLKKGDILFCDIKPIWCKFFGFNGNKGYSNDHCAMYIGNNRFIEASVYLPILFGPHKNDKLGVVVSHKFILNLWATNFTFGYVNNATSEQIEGAIKWAKKQLLSPYQWSWPNLDNYQSWHGCPNSNGTTFDPDGNKFYECYSGYWYCAELVWAAYLSQSNNLSIGSMWIKDEQDDGNYHWVVSPRSIRNDENNFTLYSDL